MVDLDFIGFVVIFVSTIVVYKVTYKLAND